MFGGRYQTGKLQREQKRGVVCPHERVGKGTENNDNDNEKTEDTMDIPGHHHVFKQQQQQHQQQPAPAMNGRQSTAFTATTGVLPGTVVGGRPPRSETSAPRGRGGAGSLSSPAPAPVPRGSAPTNTSVRQKGLRNGTTASHQRSSSHEAPLTTAATVDSPSREALSSVNIRQIAGLESPVTNDKSGPTSAVRRLDPPEDGTGGAGAGGEGDGRRVFGAITDAAEAGRFALMRIAKWRLDPRYGGVCVR